MKIRRLPEIDLARIGPLSVNEQRGQLRQHKVGRPPFSYEPLRRSIQDVINVSPDLFGPADPTPWQEVVRTIWRLARSENEFESNVAVAQSLHAYCITEQIRARHYEIGALPLSIDLKVAYWWPFVMLIGGCPLIPFFDPRRSRHLTSIGRRFAFSMMNQAVRAADPDLADVRLGIFQFETAEDGTRLLRLHTDEGIHFFDFDELDVMIRATYEIWSDVLVEREEDARRRGSARRGPLI